LQVFAMEHWYVYYKMPVAELPALLPRVRALQASLGLAAAPGLQTRVDTPDGIATVMEIYPDIADAAGFARTLERAVAASDLPAALRAGRRTERFRSL
jgi:hypothetical protein